MADSRRPGDPTTRPLNDPTRPLNDAPVAAGPVVGIFSLFFREAGAFWAYAYDQAECAVREYQGDARGREERRRLEAQARLLEEMRRAKEAGLDPEAVLQRFQQLP